MRAVQRRRHRIRVAVIGVPLVATLVVLIVALAGGLGGADVALPPLPSSSYSRSSASVRALEDAAEARSSAEAGGVAEVPSAAAPVPSDRAALVVKGPPEGYVYVTGKPLGPTDTRIVTDCGQRFVRVGTKMGERGLASVRWLAEGQSIRLECGETKVVSAKPR